MTEKQFENLMYAIALNTVVQMVGEFRHAPGASTEWAHNYLHAVKRYEQEAKQVYEYLMDDPMNKDLSKELE